VKLELQHIKIKNFLSFGAKTQKVDFLPGVNVVLGYDAETGKSNAAGKSSLLEVIPFTLFGQIHRDIKKEQIINWKNKKKCEVELSFKKGDVQYRVVRGIKPDNFEIYKDGILIPRPSHVRDYQKILEDIVGLNYQTFMSLIHSNINSSQPILAMKKPEKRKFMEKIFGLELYTKLNDLCNNKSGIVKKKIFEGEIKVNSSIERISNSKDRIGDLKRNLIIHKNSQMDLNEAIEKLSDIDSNQDELERELEIIKNNYMNSNASYIYHRDLSNKVSGKVDLIRVKIVNVSEKITDIEEEVLREEQRRKRKLELEKTIKQYGSVEELKHSIDEKKSAIDEKKSAIDVLNKNYSKEWGEYTVLEHDIKSKRERVEWLKKNPTCPTCGQDITDCDHIVKTTTDEIDKLLSKKKDSEHKQYMIKNMLKNHDLKIKVEEKHIEVSQTVINNILKMESKIGPETTKSYANEKIRFEEKWKRYKAAIVKLLELKRDIQDKKDKLDRSISLLEERETELESKITMIRIREEEVSRLEIKVEDERENRELLENLIDKEEKIIDGDTKSIAIERKKLARYKEMIDYLNHIKVLCKDEEVKQYAISTIIPYLNKKTNYYLSEVGHPFYVILDKWLEADIRGPGITKGSYGSLSGGESRSIDLALQLAFLDVARLQAGVWPDVVVFDELLDSSVDSLSINKLMDIIVAKQRDDKNSKVFIISHRKEIGEFDVDHEYKVEKIGGYSKVEVK